MRYLYKIPDTTYKELMMSAKEAEAEWIDNKARVKSTVINEDPGKKEREELKQRIIIIIIIIIIIYFFPLS